jgi:hypothetical protein
LRQWLVDISTRPNVFHPLPAEFFDSDTRVVELASGSSKPLDAIDNQATAEKAAERNSAGRPIRSQEAPAAAPEIDGANRLNRAEFSPKNPWDPEVFNRKAARSSNAKDQTKKE